MITKVFADGQVWNFIGRTEEGDDRYINLKNRSFASFGYLQAFADFQHLVVEGGRTLQRTETPESQEIPSKQGDCIAELVHTLAVELQLTYSYHPATNEFLVDHNDYTFKLKSSDDIGKLRHLVSLMEELSYEG